MNRVAFAEQPLQPMQADTLPSQVPIIEAHPETDYLSGQTHVSKDQLRFSKDKILVEVPVMQPDGQEAAVHVEAPAGLVVTNDRDPSDLFFIKPNGDIRPFSAWKPPKVVRQRQELVRQQEEQRHHGRHAAPEMPSPQRTAGVGKAALNETKPKHLRDDSEPTVRLEGYTEAAPQRQKSWLRRAAEKIGGVLVRPTLQEESFDPELYQVEPGKERFDNEGEPALTRSTVSGELVGPVIRREYLETPVAAILNELGDPSIVTASDFIREGLKDPQNAQKILSQIQVKLLLPLNSRINRKNPDPDALAAAKNILSTIRQLREELGTLNRGAPGSSYMGRETQPQ